MYTEDYTSLQYITKQEGICDNMNNSKISCPRFPAELSRVLASETFSAEKVAYSKSHFVN